MARVTNLACTRYGHTSRQASSQARPQAGTAPARYYRDAVWCAAPGAGGQPWERAGHQKEIDQGACLVISAISLPRRCTEGLGGVEVVPQVRAD